MNADPRGQLVRAEHRAPDSEGALLLELGPGHYPAYLPAASGGAPSCRACQCSRPVFKSYQLSLKSKNAFCLKRLFHYVSARNS
jgi:hypothetical protein